MDEVENKTDCIHQNGRWVNYQYNFDNLFEALMSLFVVSTKDGWVDIMQRGIDARGVDMQVRYSFLGADHHHYVNIFCIIC